MESLIIPTIFSKYHLKVKAFFTTRRGGGSPPPFDSFNLSFEVGDSFENVKNNYNYWEKITGLKTDTLFTVSQEHGNNVVIIKDNITPEAVKNIKGDAIITTIKNCTLGVKTADCAPILIASIDEKLIAIVHVGWRGVVKGILNTTLKVIIEQFNIPPSNLITAIGPCIGSCCYKIGYELIPDFFPILPIEKIFSTRNNTLFFDLREAVRLQLLQNGLRENQIEIINLCTYCNKELFFSYRRDGKKTGRMLNTITLI